MENNKLVQQRFGRAIKVLSYLSAAWCAVAIIVVVTLLISSTSNQIWETLTHPDAIGPEFAGELSFLALFCGFIVLVSGLALERFVLRALPPRFLKRSRNGWFDIISAIALCFFLGGLLVFGVILFFVAPRMDTASSNPLDETSLARVGLGAILAGLCICFAVGPLILRHWKVRTFLDRPFVLFLRRFSTFADRAVVALVLKQAPSGVPVVFLAPALHRPGDWDPFLVGFAGFKILNPWKSVPIVLSASNEDWRHAAEELIRRAQIIVVDTSETSSALRIEGDMIAAADRWSDTVCLKLLRDNVGPDENLFGYSGRARVIDYRKSWVRALPKILSGLAIVPLTTLFLSIPLLGLTPVLGGHVAYVASILLSFAAASAYYSVFVRPTINRDAKSSLRKMLRGY